MLSALVPHLTYDTLERLPLTQEDRWAVFQNRRTAAALRLLKRIRPEWCEVVLLCRAEIDGFDDKDLARMLCGASASMVIDFKPCNTHEERIYNAVWFANLNLLSKTNSTAELQARRKCDSADLLVAIDAMSGFGTPGVRACIEGCHPEQLEHLVESIPLPVLKKCMEEYIRHLRGHYNLIPESAKRIMRQRVLYNTVREPRKSPYPWWTEGHAIEPRSDWAWEAVWDMKRLEYAGGLLMKAGGTLDKRVDSSTDTITASRGVITDAQWSHMVKMVRDAIVTVVDVARDWDLVVTADLLHKNLQQLECMGVPDVGSPLMAVEKKGVYTASKSEHFPMTIDNFVKVEVGGDIGSMVGELVDAVSVLVQNMLTANSSLDLNNAIKRRLQQHEMDAKKRKG